MEMRSTLGLRHTVLGLGNLWGWLGDMRTIHVEGRMGQSVYKGGFNLSL